MSNIYRLPEENPCDFVHIEKRVLLQTAMKAVNQIDLFESIYYNWGGYDTPESESIEHVRPILDILEKECHDIIIGIRDWSTTFIEIMTMIDEITKYGFLRFEKNYEEKLLKYCMNDGERYKVGQFILVKTRNSGWNWRRGKIISILDDSLYMVHYIEYNDIDNIEPHANIRMMVPLYNTLPNDPDFLFITDVHTRSMIEDGYKGVMKSEGWNILRNFSGDSFMITRDPEVKRVMTAINNESKCDHSGCSLALTMRQLERISHIGMNKFKMEWKNSLE